MLRCCSVALCSAVHIDTAFRRSLGSQSTLLDLIPVKKPLLDGSLSWFVDENIEIVLVSGVKGTSPDEVTNSVKRRAVRLLQQCGDDDAAKGSHAIRRCVEEAATVRRLLRRLDLQVRLRLWSQDALTHNGSAASSEVSVATGSFTGEEEETSSALYCSIYETDTWEPHQQERHLGDVSAVLSVQPLGKLLCEALQVVRRNAEAKERRFVADSYHEASLVLSAAAADRAFTARVFSLMKELVPSFTEDPAARWIAFPASYTVEFDVVKWDNDETGISNPMAGSWVLCDDVGNTEMRDVPLVVLKGKTGFVYYEEHPSSAHQHPQHLLEESRLEQLVHLGAIARVSTRGSGNYVPGVMRSFWAQPLLQALLLLSSGEFLCGRFAPTQVEDFVGSCGRIDVDSWLSDRGKPLTAPLTPLYLQPFSAVKFLQECLPLELGGRASLTATVGPLCFGYYVAATSGGRVATATNCFSSVMTALSMLLPWYEATPVRPTLTEHTNHQDHQQQPKQETDAETRNPSSPKETFLGQLDDAKLLVVHVIDAQKTLTKLGVASGVVREETVEYLDAAGRRVLFFEQMDTLPGIERLVKRMRRSPCACFLSVTFTDNARTTRVVSSLAFGGPVPPKPPPYVKRIRIPVPLVPGAFFSLRFTGLFDKEQKEHGLLQIFERYAEDPKQWPLRRPSPCFFNCWRLTRGIIDAITRHDAQFRYTLDRTFAKDGGATVTLRFYSGEDMTQETLLQERELLPHARRCFAEYAARWSVDVPPAETVFFSLQEIKKTMPLSCRSFVGALLQNSEACIQRGDGVYLELQITADVKVLLAFNKKGNNVEGARELISRTFLEEQFPMLYPITVLLRQAHRFLSLNSGEGEGDLMFSCQDNSDVGRGYRWELQRHANPAGAGASGGGGGGVCVSVLEAAEGPSRLGALTALLEKLDPHAAEAAADDSAGVVEEVPEAMGRRRTKSVVRAFIQTAQPQTIEEYQAALALQRGAKKILHAYNATLSMLLVKSVDDGGHGEAQTETVIRAIPLTCEFPIGAVVHQYYRRELRLPVPPPPLDANALRQLSLVNIYSTCQSNFVEQLPPLNEALKVSQTRRGWCAVLRLPGRLFALDAPSHVEFVLQRRGKHEAKRDVVCQFFHALHGPTPAELAQVLSEAICNDPPPCISSEEKDASRSRSSSCGTAGPVTSRGKDACMYDELVRLVGASLRTLVGYDGAVEFRLSFITGISARYVCSPPCNGDSVELFHAPFHPTLWLPLQVLETLVSCARRLVPEADLEACLLRGAAAWPSLFLDTARNERLFCTTFLRRYLGLRTYEENDVDECAAVPGTMYAVERTQCVSAGRFEASLLLLQTPRPPITTTFTKVLASHLSSSPQRAELELWRGVAQRLAQLHESRAQEGVDRAVLRAVSVPGVGATR
ncbi:hypothetical protein DQ04_01841040 [Trypanosoma grayi]|uniref:hypothetical protein n=1 Tax=Trypanosoma grayi TaxID=71804 RepID=UPI0004F46CD5|nr:hypothetical protein DQ04_01841040 [Trypanosoma grayi]KEG12273.1 hypothetical protein DQ04_01841040 [Trypanosoma grayi]